LKLSTDGSQIVSETILYDNVYGRLRDVAVAPDGRVFIATSNRDGRGRAPFPRTEDDRIIELKSAVTGPTIDAPTLLPATVERGAQLQVGFNTTGAFTTGNEFAAQLSDSSGAFGSPRVLGTFPSNNGGIITTTIPCDIPSGSNYMVRIVSSAPVATSPSTRLIVQPSPKPVIASSAGRAICIGGNTVLSVTGGTRASWRPAGGLSCSDCSSPVAAPISTTTYTVTVMNQLGCEVSDTFALTVNPLPTPAITQSNGVLSTPTSYASYQWLLDSINIPGATSPTHTARINGSYTVRVVDSNGCTGLSAPVAITNVGIELSEARNRDLRISPQPVSDHLTIELALGRRGEVRIEIIDMRGATIHSLLVDAPDGTVNTVVDVRSLAAGAYVVSVASGAERWARTMIR
ncbi:MAG: hypothetical protein H7X80_10490, partial [bacterium]|nr:hypothetical protein [Candidatus Kapabacteria bacterium]